MRVIKYDPLRQIQGIRDQMNQWLGSFGEPVDWERGRFSRGVVR